MKNSNDNFTNKPTNDSKEVKSAVDLQQVRLPLSQETYDKLQHALAKSQIKWEDLPTELNHAYQNFDRVKRRLDWEHRVREGKISEYE